MKNLNCFFCAVMLIFVSIVFSCKEEESLTSVLTSINIKNLPNKVVYVSDENFDSSGMSVVATYDNGNTKDVTGGCAVIGFDSSVPVVSQNITVSYTENGVTKTAAFVVKIVKCDYKFHESVELLPAGTDGTLGKNGNYVLFGDWPQTVLSKTKQAKLVFDESNAITRGGFSLVPASDGYYYVKATENAVEDSYKYTDGSNVQQSSAGSTRYFKVEPIKWRVLATSYGGGKLLLAENELMANVPYYENDKTNRTIGGGTVYPNNYMHSQMRAYLNGINYQSHSGTSSDNEKWFCKGFLQSAFTSAAQQKILTPTVDNSPDSTTDATGSVTKADAYFCANTSDKIFLLSEKEVTTTSYGFEDYHASGVGSSRIRIPTDYALANYAYKYSAEGWGGAWWLRSPYSDNAARARRVYGHGGADGAGFHVDHGDDGIVPALCVAN